MVRDINDEEAHVVVREGEGMIVKAEKVEEVAVVKEVVMMGNYGKSWSG